MRDYFRYFPEYFGRCFRRIDFICGGVIALVYFFVADCIGLASQKTYVVIAIVALSVLEASYGVYRQERIMRAEWEKNIKITARQGAISVNFPNPGSDKVSLSVHVLWEVWVNQDISVDSLGLNLIYVYKKHWWQLWKRTSVPQVGIPPKGLGTTQYRRKYYANQIQPNHDEAVFEYIGDRKKAAKASFTLELVLTTGVPVGKYRIPVFTDWDEIRKRGTNPPL